MNIPTPAGAVTIDPEWVLHDRQQGTELRHFTGSSWRIPVASDHGKLVDHAWLVMLDMFIEVEIVGAQNRDGRIYRWINTVFPEKLSGSVDYYDLPPEAARLYADALRAAADEAERMNAADGGVMSSFPTFSAVDR